MSHNRISNRLIQPRDYASFMVIAKYRKIEGGNPSGLYFNKIMSLSHRKLKKNGIDIKLPHYWYRFGDQVFRYDMSGVKWHHESPTDTMVEWEYEEPDTIQNEPYISIEETVHELTEEYAQNIHKAIEEVYSEAPFQFQREYYNLREIFFGKDYAFNWDEVAYKTLSMPTVIKTFSTFPIDDFPELRRMYDVINEFINVSLEEDWSFNLLQHVCTNFWLLFCYHLRLHGRAHENISKETLSIWAEKIELENYRYRKIISDFIIEYVKINDSILERGILKDEYDWRILDRKESESVIDECYEYLKELN